MKAKQLFDHVAKSREEGATVPYQSAMGNLLNTKFTTTAKDYCGNFMWNYMGVNSAAESMVPRSSNSDTVNPFVIPHGVASHLFIIGTEAIEWLSTWRQTKVFDSNNHYVSLETMMSTLRQTSAGQMETIGRVVKLNELSGNMSKLAPKSKGKKKRGKKGKAKVSAGKEIFDDKDNSDEDDGVSLATVAKISPASFKNKNPLLYDTGASHHFIRVKKNFITLKKLANPFEFDQSEEHQPFKILSKDIPYLVPEVPSISEENWPQQQDDRLETHARSISPALVNNLNDKTPSKRVRLNSLQDDQASQSSDGIGSIDQEDQGELEIMDRSPIHDEMKYDQIMTGWDGVAPIAAMDGPKAKYWREAAEEKLRLLKDTGTLQVIHRSKLPKGRTLMKCKWVFKRKFLADGSLEKNRARCTVKEFTQRRGIDYNETFAPTPRPEIGLHGLESRRSLICPTCAGEHTKKQMKTYRQVGKREYQSVQRTRITEELVASAGNSIFKLKISHDLEVAIKIDNILASHIENSKDDDIMKQSKELLSPLGLSQFDLN
ncbi:hypothetical protein EPUL_001039 [Erysiphe pulchra]|uniref:Reverse transcriptase Ty1/copia-type domain-containing protein n=1 Tax=Erysiphe pulchra TaxID=225359 RepID=A0A2S4PVL2_9PEZI|nr:hypothetical protein EPUL_001039 [Erysiphe pulchra]